MKKIFLVLSLFICAGCSNSVKKVPVANFDYKKMKQVSYVTDKNNQQIDKRYNVANNHFEYVKATGGYCTTDNKVSKEANENTYMVIEPVGTKMMNVHIYQKQNNKCEKMQSINKVTQVSADNVSYNSRVYVNVISGDEKLNKSGLWVLDGKGKKHLSKFKTLSTRFDVDRKTGHLYTIEMLDDESSYLREYNKADKKVNEYQNKDDEYMNLFFNKGKISLTSLKFIEEKDGEKLYNYLVTTLPIKTFFDDLKNKKDDNVVEIEAKGGVAAGEVKNDYIVFDGGNDTVVCKLDYSKCNKYYSNVEMFDGKGYIGISEGETNDSVMYLNKFGTNGVEKVLNNTQSYFTHQEGKNIYFHVFDCDDESKSKIIKYTLK